jgi:murein DD-endopeptidase MepM/ murein hydrolase activator NlpD
MQLIVITRSDKSLISLKLVGWRLWLAVGFISAILLLAMRIGMTINSESGSLTESVIEWWKLSREDSLAKELGSLKAKVDLLESTLSVIEGNSSNLPAGDYPKDKAPRMEELEIRVKKISLTIDDIVSDKQKIFERISTGPAAHPISTFARISSGYGMRRDPFSKRKSFHRGVDFIAKAGTPVYAVGDGVVEVMGRMGGYGNLIEIRHSPQLVSAYAHLQGIEVVTGMPVRAGQRIARVGSTGRSTGSHLHFELVLNNRPINPRPFLARVRKSEKLAKLRVVEKK